MKHLRILNFALCLFTFSLLMTSCSKENVEEIEEVTETTYEMRVTLRSTLRSYDAFAAYCNQNGVESFSVSNNLELLDNDNWTEDIEDGDFVIHYRSDADGALSLSGAIIESTTPSGDTIKNFSTAVDDPNSGQTLATLTIDTANSTEIIGSMSGDFLVLIDPLSGVIDQVPFEVSFAGEVDPSLTPILCQ